MDNVEFAYPDFLYGLLVLPLLLFWYWKKNNANRVELQVSSLMAFEEIAMGVKVKLRHLVFVLRLAAIGLLFVALARPQSSTSWQNVTTEGIDIVMAIDISSSMLAEDFKPNRLEASKAVALEFIGGRPNDRVGLVVFSGESFTQCPLTTDHSVLRNLFEDIKSGIIEDGTAIGMGLATGVARLKDSEAKSKVVILLTDGVNNAGSIAPITAADIASSFGVRVYTIGVGSKGTAPYPIETPFGKQYRDMEVKIDEEMLKEIAANTGGVYYRAVDKNKLGAIYEDIDKLEKSKIEVTEFRKKTERFLPWVLLAAFCLLLEFLLKNTVFRSIP